MNTFFKTEEEYQAFIARKAIEQGIVEPVIEFVKGPPGPEGPQGEPGESIIGPQGPEGPQGKPGNNGYTPQRGFDYYTEADKNTFIIEVLKKVSIPKDGVSPRIEDVVARALEELKKNPISDTLVTKDELVAFLRKGGFRGGGGAASQSTQDRDTQSAVLSYSGTNLLSIVYANGDTVVFTYSGTNVATKVTTYSGKITHFAYGYVGTNIVTITVS